MNNLFGKKPTIVETEQPPLTLGATDHNSLTVETIDNHVYFYSTVNADRCLALIQKIREVDTKLRTEQASRDMLHPTPIWLHIQSGGGLLFAGLAMADQLSHIKSPIYSIVEGYCASAATLISMSATRRLIQPSAFFLIHQLSSGAWGKYDELRDEMHLLDMAMETMIKFYCNKSNLSKRQIKKLLKRDSWFSAQDALAAGFVDEIVVNKE